MSNKLNKNLSIAAILLEEAKNQDVTVEKLADEMESTRSTLYNWKRVSSKMPVKGLIQMCRILHTPVAYFPETDSWEIGESVGKGTQVENNLKETMKAMKAELDDLRYELQALKNQIGNDTKRGK